MPQQHWGRYPGALSSPPPPYTPPGDAGAVHGGGCCRLRWDTPLKGELWVLGGIQILLGILQLGCGAVLASSTSEPLRVLTARSCYFIWGGLLFILSGSSSMVAEKKRGVCVVNGCLALNVTSLLASAAGIVLVLWDLSFHRDPHSGPHLELRVTRGLLGVLLVFIAPETCITLLCVYFGWKTRLAGSTPASPAVDFIPSFVPPPPPEMLPSPPPYHEVVTAVDRRAP